MKMSATILESLSNRKLVAALAVVMVVQLSAFYIGAFLSPSPASIEQFTSVHCFKSNISQISIPRYRKHRDTYVGLNCDQTPARKAFEQTTFAVQLPLPRDGLDLAYSRWMQTLLVILDPEFQYEPLISSDGSAKHEFTILLDVNLAVKDSEQHDWKLYAQRKGLRRTIRCQMRQQHQPECDLVQLFELQSLHYDHYLINFEIREDKESNNTSIQFPGKLSEISGVAIHHNGGFTQIWLGLKTICFGATLATLIWYCKRLNRLSRKKILIENILVGLGFTLTLFNAPVEFLTLLIEIKFMTFLNDLRQGMFYCVLFSFWIIFFGEHLQDGNKKSGLSLAAYIKELLAICVASISLLVFDLSERGLQAMDPFVTIWESRPRLATFSIGIASVAALAYIMLLTYYIYLAYATISGSKLSLPKMQMTKRLKYQGIIYRFKFLLSATMVCALSTFLFYVLSQRNEWYYDEDNLKFGSNIEWTSAMLITVCAMWNLYVMVLMILYAPSYKGLVSGVYTSDQIEFDCLTEDKEEEIEGDMKLLQQISRKLNLE